MKFFLGVDIGSVSVKMAVLDEEKVLRWSVYMETAGAPLEALCKAAADIKNAVEKHSAQISGIGVTGSSRKLAALVLGADIIKNEVTAQTVAALHYNPRIATVIEIGGQDSKVILLKNGVPVWHNLNTLCAAGTGSFLTSQAMRLDIPIEEFGKYALRSTVNVSIASKCAVFSESDMIHKAALGCRKEDIINGLCEGLVRNFINNVARNREMPDPIIFVGGVASNIGVVRAFEAALKTKINVPKEHRITGCVAMALLALKSGIKESVFKGFALLDKKIKADFFLCEGCPNQCEITRIYIEGKNVGCFGSKCGKHNSAAEVNCFDNFAVLKSVTKA